MRRRLLEHGKSLLIALLALSAVFLLTQTYVDESGAGLLGALRRAMATGASVESKVDLKAATVPVRIAVCNKDGRLGVQYDQTASDKLYAELNTLLTEALGSAKQGAGITEQAWRAALSSEGIYFEFLSPVPLDALSAWLGGGKANAQLGADAQRILIASDADGSVFLYYINENDGMFYACETAGIFQDRLEDAVSRYLPNGAAFAFEESGLFDRLDPYTMLLPRRPVCKVLSAANPFAGQDAPEDILTALDFNPYTNFTYSVSGAQVVREGSATLRISETGRVVYHGGDDASRLRIDSKGETPTEAEIIEGARRLAEMTVGAHCGQARLFLIGTDWDANADCEVRFGYSVGGAAVQLGDEGYAASILVSGGRVTDCTLLFREYRDTGVTVSLLPEQQAAAALEGLEAGGGRLLAGYIDRGEETLNPGWILWERGFWL